MRRKRFSFAEINRIKVIKSVEREYVLFRHKMYRQSKKQIFDAHDQISFYDVVHDYFTNCNMISDEVTNRLAGTVSVIDELWQTFLNCTGFYINTWADVCNLLQVYFERERFIVNY